MKILLDTCTFLWITANAKELSRTAKALFSAAENEVYLSSVSVWEIMVKNQLGKLPLPDPVENFIKKQRTIHRIATLALSEEATLQLPRLPNHHNDPFDRMLICQAIVSGLTFLTPDPHINQYPIHTIW